MQIEEIWNVYKVELRSLAKDLVKTKQQQAKKEAEELK